VGEIPTIDDSGTNHEQPTIRRESNLATSFATLPAAAMPLSAETKGLSGRRFLCKASGVRQRVGRLSGVTAPPRGAARGACGDVLVSPASGGDDAARLVLKLARPRRQACSATSGSRNRGSGAGS
jgi:hypothetical protein